MENNRISISVLREKCFLSSLSFLQSGVHVFDEILCEFKMGTDATDTNKPSQSCQSSAITLMEFKSLFQHGHFTVDRDNRNLCRFSPSQNTLVLAILFYSYKFQSINKSPNGQRTDKSRGKFENQIRETQYLLIMNLIAVHTKLIEQPCDFTNIAPNYSEIRHTHPTHPHTVPSFNEEKPCNNQIDSMIQLMILLRSSFKQPDVPLHL